MKNNKTFAGMAKKNRNPGVSREYVMSRALAKLDSKSDLEHLEDLESLTEDLDSETLEALEDLENVAGTETATAIAKVMKSHKNAGHACGKGPTKLKEASVTFKITRTVTVGNARLVDGNGNPVVLPIPLFGCLESESNFTRIFAAFLPKDGSVLVKSFSKTSDAQGYIVTFKNVDDTRNETVTIMGTNTVLTNLVRGLSSYQFDVVKPKIIIGDVLRTDQFDQPLQIFNGSMFTSANTDNISPQDYKSDILSDNTVRILNDTICVNPEKTLVPLAVAPTNAANGSSFYFTITCPLKNFRQA